MFVSSSYLRHCIFGFSILDYRIGPCYTRVINDMCQGQLEGVVCTKQLCCATIGQAWGHPCEQCSLSYDCDVGFLKNLHTNQCIGEWAIVDDIQKADSWRSRAGETIFFSENLISVDFDEFKRIKKIIHVLKTGRHFWVHVGNTDLIFSVFFLRIIFYIEYKLVDDYLFCFLNFTSYSTHRFIYNEA